MELAKTAESDLVQQLPITAICIVSNKDRCPKGFQAISKTTDDLSDADLWRESAFSFFSRPVRYLAVSREVPETVVKGIPVSVVTDITVVRESDPIPHGFVPIDYTADSNEKALRKRFICIKTQPRDTVVDAIGEVVVLNKTKKTPKGYSNAGEVDGVTIVFKVITIPSTFGLRHSSSVPSQPNRTAPPLPGLYPNLGGNSHSMPSHLQPPIPQRVSKDDFTIKEDEDFLLVDVARPKSVTNFPSSPEAPTPVKGVDGVPFKLHPSLEKGTQKNTSSELPPIPFDVSRLNTDELRYNFQLERSILSS